MTRINRCRPRAGIVEPMKSILLTLFVLLLAAAVFIGEVAVAFARG